MKPEFPFTGYLLLPMDKIDMGYRGVQRQPFEPLLPLDIPRGADVSRIWTCFPDGWKRNAYRMFEEDKVEHPAFKYLEIIKSYDTALEIKRIIEPNIGKYEILRCHIYPVDHPNSQLRDEEPMFLGYDVAYPGGDFYSALPALYQETAEDAILRKRFYCFLNEYKMFNDFKIIPEYLRVFRDVVTTERNSMFVVYGLYETE